MAQMIDVLPAPDEPNEFAFGAVERRAIENPLAADFAAHAIGRDAGHRPCSTPVDTASRGPELGACPCEPLTSFQTWGSDMSGPLDGYTVIDMSAVVSGPMCAQVLGDQGADVIKIEPMGIGDITRLGGYRVGDVSAMFLSCNRGKKSVALDLGQEAGIEAVRRLAATADVFVQNFRPGATDRMGIGPEALHAINPDLIYVSISGFGPTGPYSQWRVYDPIIQAISGVPSVQRSMDIPIPDLVRTIIGDKSTALTAAQAVTGALLARERGRARGQHLEIPMLDTLLYFLWPDNFMGETFTGEVTPGPLLHDIYRLQQTADGNMVYFAVSDAEWEGLCTALGHPEWWEDERFNTIAERSKPENFEAIGAMLNNAFIQWPTDEILDRLHEFEVPAAPVNELGDVFEDPQVVHNEAIHYWDHPLVGPTRSARQPVRFSDTQPADNFSADSLGQSTRQVLGAVGYSDAELDALTQAGVTN